MRKIVLTFIAATTLLFAQSESYTQYVKVTHSKPVYETIEEIIPHRHDESCFEEYEVRVPKRYKTQYKDENSIGVDTLVGIAGGIALGNQIGKGNGRTAAKVIGGLLGANVANNLRNYHHVDDINYDQGYRYETRTRNICADEPQRVVTKRVLKGYKNYFVHNGKRYHKFSTYKKKRVRLTTTISF